jgi:hypothetical protein
MIAWTIVVVMGMPAVAVLLACDAAGGVAVSWQEMMTAVAAQMEQLLSLALKLM